MAIKWKGSFNWYGQVLELWTEAYTKERAKMNFFARLVKILDLDKEYAYAVLKSHYNGEKDNFRIERTYT